MNKYYEIWFYYYGEKDERSNIEKEFTFYIKIDREITSTEDMKKVLTERMNDSNKEEAEKYKNWLDGQLEHISNWFEISAKEFTCSSGIPA